MNALITEKEVNSTTNVATGALSDTSRYGFRVGPFGFLFPENCPGEVVTAPVICPIPHTRAWMTGVISLRGNLIPVFDLHGLLFDVPASINKPMVLILDQDKQALGFVLQDSPQWLRGLIEVPIARASIPDMIADQVSKAYRHQEMDWLAFSKTDFFTFLGECSKSC